MPLFLLRTPALSLFLALTHCQSLAVQYEYYTVKDSPHPHSPLELGLVNVNSEVNSVSVQSIVVPTTLKSAIGSMCTTTPCGAIMTLSPPPPPRLLECRLALVVVGGGVDVAELMLFLSSSSLSSSGIGVGGRI